MCKLVCTNCEFKGTDDNLILCIEDKDGNLKKYHGEKFDDTEEEVFKGCPNCLTDNYLMYTENVE